MIKEAIATGESTEIAFKNACDILGVATTEAKSEVLEEAVKKTFGIFGGSPAKVRAYIVITPAIKAKDYIELLLTKMDIQNIKIDIKEEEDGCILNVDGDNISFIIGHRGDTLDSLQYLASLVANQGEEKYYRISIDVGNFREKRKEVLENLGRKVAGKAIKYGRNQVLEPMNPYERRIIHTVVGEVDGVKSWSEGSDLTRHVVIGPIAGEKKFNNRGPRNSNGRNQRDNRGGQRSNYSKPANRDKPYRNEPKIEDLSHKISESAPVPFSPAPIDTNTQRKKVDDAPLYGKIDKF